MTMNPEVKEKWAAALRSDKYAQGRMVMKNVQGQFCCLGVLCDLYAQETGKTWGPVSHEHGGDAGFQFGGAVNYPPAEVLEWAGLTTFNPSVSLPGFQQKKFALALLNDGETDAGELSFEQIAAAIEAGL